jgi:putative nucleotidyltransferase with HDIG domain
MKMMHASLPQNKHEIKQSIKNLDIVNGIGAGLSLIDKNMKVVWLNKIQSQWFGIPGKIRGSYCYKTYQHTNAICSDCPVVKSFKTGKIEYCRDMPYVKKGKKQRYYQLTAAPIRDIKGRVTHVLELIQDVTRQKEMEIQEQVIKKGLEDANQKLLTDISSMESKTRELRESANMIKRLNVSLEKKVRQKTENLQLLYKELLTIFEISRIVSSSLDTREVFSLIAKMSCELLNARASDLRLLDEKKQHLLSTGNFGLTKNYLNNTLLRSGEGIAGLIVKNKKPITITDICKDERVRYPKYIHKEGITAMMGVPIIFDGEATGALIVYKEAGQKYAINDELILATFASQASIAIKNAQLHRSVNETYLDTINTLVLTVEARDSYTQGHSSRVTRYAIDIARSLKVSDMEIESLRRCGKLHDIGKIAIPDSLLKAPKILSITEKAQIELHPIIGVRIVAPLKFLEYGVSVIRSHHERYDGNGYPDGIRGRSIPMVARILSVADAFDAMTSDRAYRRKLDLNEAMKELELNSGTQFDPVVVETFLKLLRRPPRPETKPA